MNYWAPFCFFRGIINFQGIKEDKLDKLIEFIAQNGIPSEMIINFTEGSIKKNGCVIVYGTSEKNVIEQTDKIQLYSLKSNMAGNIQNLILKDIDYLLLNNKIGMDLNKLMQPKNKEVKKFKP
jgi:hypothetical protein